jgi:hypothetical protein
MLQPVLAQVTREKQPAPVEFPAQSVELCFERPGRERNFQTAQDRGGTFSGDQLVIEAEMTQARIGGGEAS